MKPKGFYIIYIIAKDGSELQWDCADDKRHAEQIKRSLESHGYKAKIKKV